MRPSCISYLPDDLKYANEAHLADGSCRIALGNVEGGLPADDEIGRPKAWQQAIERLRRDPTDVRF